MDMVNYINESERQLYNTNFYVETQTNLTATHIISIKEIVDEMLENEDINEKKHTLHFAQQRQKPMNTLRTMLHFSHHMSKTALTSFEKLKSSAPRMKFY